MVWFESITFTVALVTERRPRTKSGVSTRRDENLAEADWTQKIAG